METSFKISGTSRCKSRKQRKKRAPRKGSELPLRNFGIVKQNKKKNELQKMKISRRCLSSIVQDLYEHQISLDLTEERNRTEYKQWRSNLLEQTIDLCDGDSAVNSSNSSASVPPPADKPKQTIVIDLSNDFPKQKEVIDLTETGGTPFTGCQPLANSQPNVIDISDETLKEEEPNPKCDNDEIFIIGTFTSTRPTKKASSSDTSLPRKWNTFSSLVTCSEKLKAKYLKKHSVLNDKIPNNNICQFDVPPQNLQRNLAKVGENVYVNSPVTLPSSGLRPIIIDGSNVAYVRSSCNFSCKRLEICINYFKEKGHKVTAFVPQFRLSSHRSDDPQLLRRLEKHGDVVLTPSKKIDGRNIVPYDDSHSDTKKPKLLPCQPVIFAPFVQEGCLVAPPPYLKAFRFIVQTAVLQGGIIVTRDNYNDLLRENPAWAETIKYRTLAFTWVDDVLMFPKDPLGEYGPSLEQFLRFH